MTVGYTPACAFPYKLNAVICAALRSIAWGIPAGYNPP